MAAAESAVMTSFLALAERECLEVLGYVSSARVERGAGPDRAFRVIVRPCIVVACDDDVVRARSLFASALTQSALATALAAFVRVDADMVVLGSA